MQVMLLPLSQIPNHRPITPHVPVCGHMSVFVAGDYQVSSCKLATDSGKVKVIHQFWSKQPFWTSSVTLQSYCVRRRTKQMNRIWQFGVKKKILRKSIMEWYFPVQSVPFKYDSVIQETLHLPEKRRKKSRRCVQHILTNITWKKVNAHICCLYLHCMENKCRRKKICTQRTHQEKSQPILTFPSQSSACLEAK